MKENLLGKGRGSAPGYGLVRIKDAGPYKVRFRLYEESTAAGTATLAVGEVTYQEN